MRAEHAFLDWTLIDGHLCAVRLDGSAIVNSSRLKHHSLFVVSVYGLTEEKDELYRQLSRLLHSVRPTVVVVGAVDLNAQI